MKHRCLLSVRPLGFWLVVALVLWLVPSIASADAVCVIGSTGGPCPGAVAPAGSPPFATPNLPVPEGLTQIPLPPGVFVFAGDVLVFDDPGMTILGDVLRFPQIGTSGLAGFVILLSAPADPVDTGLPTSFQANTFSMTENAGGPTLYTANPGSPGQVYDILSDSELVPDAPEPATFSCMALAGLACLVRLARLR